MKPSRAKRSQDRLLDRAVMSPWDDSLKAKWEQMSDESFEDRVKEQANEREAEDLLILMAAL